MNAAGTLRDARRRAALTQGELARRAGTSQTAVSAYESGRKRPSLDTFGRLLAAAGARLTVEPEPPARAEPSPARLRRTGRTLLQVLELAEALPTRHEPELRFPRLDRAA